MRLLGCWACALVLWVTGCSSNPPAPARESTESPILTDLAGDGTPDLLLLDDAADRDAFAGWFTFLAEAQYYRPAGERPVEINDCAALLRFAYREALRVHDGEWADRLGLRRVPPLPAIGKYNYPFTPLGANLFRITPGPFQPEDLTGGAFAQFADAKTLQRLNTHFIGRDLGMARPSDLLFFEQVDQESPFHAMVFIGAGYYETEAGPWIVYHTGPTGNDPGEIRRRSVSELLAHPRPQWRPLPGNVHFLGVHRWNILKEAF